MSLFRKEVLEHQQQKLQGKVLIPGSLSSFALTVFLGLIIIILIIFLIFASYARKESVRGYLVPEYGITRLYAHQDGIAESVLVKEGDEVIIGQALVAITSGRHLADGSLARKSILTTLDQQLEEVRTRIDLQDINLENTLKQLNSRIKGLKRELDSLKRQYKLQEKRLSLDLAQLEKAKRLTRQGVLSETQLMQQKDLYLQQQQNTENLNQQVARVSHELAELHLQVEKTPIDSANLLSTLRSTLSNLMQQRVQMEIQSASIIKSPINGQVSSLLIRQGQSVSSGALLVALLPQEKSLEAHLFIPSRAVGFVQSGQNVRLLYDAFPYQRFGVYQGTIKHISQSVLIPSELSIPIQGSEPVYKTTINLDQQAIFAYGKEHSLRSGMLLTAEIILDKRTLLEWLFEPIFSIKGRM